MSIQFKILFLTYFWFLNQLKILYIATRVAGIWSIDALRTTNHV